MTLLARLGATLVANDVAGSAPKGYQERKVAELCTRSGCDERPADDSNECPKHREESKIRKRRWRRRQRRVWVAKRLCLRCGGKRRQGSKWCSPCLIKAGKLKQQERDSQRDIEAPRITENVEGDGYARKRYRGQSRRGQQPWWQLDEQDLNDAIARLERAKQGLLFARSEEVAQLPRIQRQEIKSAALSHVAHAGRFLDEVLERNRFEMRDSAGKAR